ncbi:MAG: hypothetical protein JO152_05725 [Mycobacteriaceae bacterium]|nr:hypothetical protein [Mycobacteriaceae bacterium]
MTHESNDVVGPWYRTAWAKVAAVVVGTGLIVGALVVATGMQMVSSPSATAGTVTATPWAPGTWAQNMPQPGAAPAPASTTAPGGRSSSNAAGSAGSNWGTREAAAITDIGTSLQTVNTALSNQDVNGAKAGCQQLRAAGQKLGATLPSPDQDATNQLQATVDNINAAVDTCMGFGSGSDVNQYSSLIDQAKTHLDSAQQMIQSRS